MGDFCPLSETVLASAPNGLVEIAAAKADGGTLVINNRPEGEAEDQTPGPEIEAAARAAGIDYLAIPITHAGFSEPQDAAMVEALASTQGKVLAYCRSGTRSSLLWALAEAAKGNDPEALASAAAAAGYDVAPVRPAMDALSARARD